MPLERKLLKNFHQCSTHPHDYLYFAAYTLDNEDIINAIIEAKQNSHKPIKVILDAANWQKHKTSILNHLF